MNIDKSMLTLEQAKAFVLANINKGIKCPCCQQFSKKYRRKITSTMCRELISLYHLNKGNNDFIHRKDILNSMGNAAQLIVSVSGGDFAKLIYWEMIEEKLKEESKGEGRTSGFWRITEKGKAFVETLITVPKYIYLYDGVLCDKSEEEISILEAINDKFSYSELMGEI